MRIQCARFEALQLQPTVLRPANENMKAVEVWHCWCGCWRFVLTPTGPRCDDCDTYPQDWIDAP